MATNENQDIDLTHVFEKLKNAFKGILVLIYRFMRFLMRNVAILGILLITGVLLGFIWQHFHKPNYESEIIIQSNLESAKYLYETVELLDDKINQRDTIFLKNLGLYYQERSLIKKIEIKPVIQLKNLLEEYRQFDDNQVVTMLENIDGGKDFFESESLIWDYKFHTLNIVLSSDATELTLHRILLFMEDNEELQKLRNIEVKNLHERRQANNYTIAQIDTLLRNLNKSLISTGISGSQMLINAGDGFDLPRTIENKNGLLTTNAAIDRQLLGLQNLVYVVNSPTLIQRQTLLGTTIISFPFILIFLFILFHLGKRFYRTIEGFARKD